MILQRALTLLSCAALAGAGVGVPVTAAAAAPGRTPVVGVSRSAEPDASSPDADRTWLLVSGGGPLPGGLARTVAAVGGRLTASYPFGVATVTAPASFRGVPGLTSVPDDGFTLPDLPVSAAGADTAGNSTDEPAARASGLPFLYGDLFALQWGPDAVRAPRAWRDGVTGEGARVAVLDTAFDLDHPDLAPNINAALSRDFTGEGLGTDPSAPVDHGTAMAGIIAAADNGDGIVGVAPDAELVLGRVVGSDGEGRWADIIAGITYAASPQVSADVINLSLGEVVVRDGSDATATINAVSRAVRWATQQGSTVVVSAGNEGVDLTGSGRQVRLPTAAPQAIAVSATGPVGWALDPAGADVTVPLLFSNSGVPAVDFSAPGGNVDLGLTDPDRLCMPAPLAVPLPCGVFDLVLSTVDGDGWSWSAGTSQAAAHASGVAALIISEGGGDLSPAQVERELRRRAVDAGKPGRDAVHGHGFVTSGH